MKVRSLALLLGIGVVATVIVLALGQRALWRHKCEAPWPRQSEPPMPDDSARFDPESVALFQQTADAVRSTINSADAWFHLGMIYQAHGEDSLARTCYQTSLSLECRNPKAWHYLAMVEARLGSPEEALRHIARVIDLQPDYAPAYWRAGLWSLDLGQYDIAEKTARRAVERSRADRTSTLVLGRVLVQSGKYQEALAVLGPAMQQFGSDAYGHFLLGSALRGVGRDDEAAMELAMSQNAQPRWDDPWEREMLRHVVGFRARFDMALEVLNSADPSRAVPMFEALRAEQPQNHDVLVDLAVAYRRVNRSQDALAVLSDAERIQPESAMVQFHLAGILHERATSLEADAATQARAEALAHAQRAVVLAPNMADAHGLVGEVHLFGHQLDAAADAFQQAMRLDPGNERWLVRLAGVKSVQRKWWDVLELLQGYANRPTRNADALHLLAAALANTRQYDSSEAIILRGLAINPNDPRFVEALPRVRAAKSASPAQTVPGPSSP